MLIIFVAIGVVMITLITCLKMTATNHPGVGCVGIVGATMCVLAAPILFFVLIATLLI